MSCIYTFSRTHTDKYGDEYREYNFITATSDHHAWFLAGSRLCYSSTTSFNAQFLDSGDDYFYVEVWNAASDEFWDVFDEYPVRWKDSLLLWAIENRASAAQLWQMATSYGCDELTNLPELRSIAEQYQLEQEIKNLKAERGRGKSSSL